MGLRAPGCTWTGPWCAHGLARGWLCLGGACAHGLAHGWLRLGGPWPSLGGAWAGAWHSKSFCKEHTTFVGSDSKAAVKKTKPVLREWQSTCGHVKVCEWSHYPVAKNNKLKKHAILAWCFSCRGTGSRATDAVPMGVGTHTHTCLHSICFFFLIGVHRLSHWHASFHTHSLYMVHSASNSRPHWHCLVLLLASAPSKQKKRTGVLNMFFGLHFVCINCVLPLKQNLLAWSSFCKFLSFMSCIASPKQQKQNAPAHWLFPCNMFSVHIPFCTAHTGTDWAKHIGAVLFCFTTQLYIMQCLCTPFFKHLILLLTRSSFAHAAELHIAFPNGFYSSYLTSGRFKSYSFFIFGSSSCNVRVLFLLLCAVLCRLGTFICTLCALVISLYVMPRYRCMYSPRSQVEFYREVLWKHACWSAASKYLIASGLRSIGKCSVARSCPDIQERMLQERRAMHFCCIDTDKDLSD